MARLRTNIVANIGGQGWAALVQIAFVPLYLKFLGIEAYGLVGFYTVIQGILQVLDLGLSPTMMRELARYSTLPGKEEELRDFVRTLEVGYWLIGALIGAGILLGAPAISAYWINPGSLSRATVTRAVGIIGIISFFQWPLSFYQGSLMGLQKQVSFNVVKSVMSTFTGLGAILILWLVSHSINSFFTWMIFTSALQVFSLQVLLWFSLPKSHRTPKVRHELVKKVWRFAAGMSGISVTAIILTQMDKIVVSKILTLRDFGYYALASVVAGGLGMITAPVFNAIFPHFTTLATQKETRQLQALYHRTSQIMAVLLFPAAFVIAFYSLEVLQAWTGNIVTAQHTAAIVSLLILGTALNGIMNLPYSLQLAYGWTSLALWINTFFIATMIPLLILAASHFGAVGAAAVWLTLNTLYVFVGVPLTHRRLLRGQTREWFISDIGMPILISLVLVLISLFGFTPPNSRLASVVFLCTILFVVYTGAAASAKEVRGWILQRLNLRRSTTT